MKKKSYERRDYQSVDKKSCVPKNDYKKNSGSKGLKVTLKNIFKINCSEFILILEIHNW